MLYSKARNKFHFNLEVVGVKNTFPHTIYAFAATSKAAIGFADRQKNKEWWFL